MADASPDLRMQSQRLLTTKEAAAYLGLAETTLRAGRVTGMNTPAFCKLGRAVRYRIADLEAFAAERLRSSTTKAA